MSTASKPRQWMTLEEARAPETGATRSDEFAPNAAAWPEGLSRRDFIRLAGAGIAAASLTSCRLPEQKIVPYTEQPEKLIPGRPLHFATTIRVNGWARGVVVTSNEGRPTHIAGNPKHPMSQGACDAWTTAALLDLYDPDRLQSPLHRGEPVSRDEFERRMLEWNGVWLKSGGEGLGVLMAPSVSPTENRLLQELLTKFPQARCYTFDPISNLGAPMPAQTIDLTQVDVIFALESNFLLDRPDSLALTRAFSRHRQSDDGRDWNRLYVAETCPTITGAKADHRFAVAPQELDDLASSLLAALQGNVQDGARWPWLGALVDDLRLAGAKSAILGGRSLSLAAQSSIFEANNLLAGAVRSIQLPAASLTGPLSELVERMRRREVSSLFIIGGNPVLDAPADLTFGSMLESVPTAVHLTSAPNETTAACAWATNLAHDLESWGDAACGDGTLSIQQPLILPLYDGKGVPELLEMMISGTEQSGYDLVRATWQQRAALPGDAFETAWHRWLRDGVIEQSWPVSGGPIIASQPKTSIAPPPPLPAAKESEFWLGFRPSDSIWDGRHANNGWLQELADPITKLTWDNAVLMSQVTAEKFGVADADVIALQAGDVRVEAPVLIVPGHADRCLTLSLGYGRSICGSTGKDVGANAYALRTTANPWFRPLDKIERTGTPHVFAQTQLHSRIEGRDLVHVSRVDDAAPIPATVKTTEPAMPSLYPPWPAPGHRWAMTLDLNSCIGCNACVIACQSENNIPVVGKEQVYMGRAMQWIRVDRYYEGTPENPRTHFQPVPCMQCENAPCEVVCPVAATQHDDEGLNVMVYNRCVGTRYCSNNCPYKVRRFNFLFYNADIPETQRLRLNPNVTVRSRGVMEKCTYCVQRIEEARIGAERDNRPLRGNDIITACQAACPAEAIVFGDLSDPSSIVSRNREKPGHYALLGELDTRPRTTYLEKRVNPNPALDPRPAAAPSAPTPI
jgi:MoCo/4Fe-4S cofactor protein with predicted Tat translocation signal